ncbi:MAG TPA: hypothetical protein VIX73_34715, partial [Kofleriaceae bacterium]
MIDTASARRAIGGLLMAASGAPTQDDLARAADRLRGLGWPALGDGDLVRETPESLAPRVPSVLRAELL